MEAFDTLVIGSGDDIFSTAAVEYARSGKRFEVVALGSQIGATLYRVAHHFHSLPTSSAVRSKYPLDHLPVGLAYGGALPKGIYQRYRPRG